MKVQEAAHILGISLEEITSDLLKQTFQKLTMQWDADKCKDPQSKQKYIQITEAYKKLNSVMEGKESFRGEDSHQEIAAFMRMFMDMVGISENDSIPAAAMTFGMMFGSQPNSMDEWSTDEEGDYEEDEDGDFLGDEYYEDFPSLTAGAEGDWEGGGKTFLHDVQTCEEEEEKKIRATRKRADKKKKQKEKKTKECKVEEEEMIPGPHHSLDQLQAGDKTSILTQRDHLRSELLHVIMEGQIITFEAMLGLDGKNVTASSSSAAVSITDKALADLREDLPLLYPVHRCITNYMEEEQRVAKGLSETVDLKVLAARRLSMARQLLTVLDPPVDLALYDDQGLSILHKSVLWKDNDFVEMVIQLIQNDVPPSAAASERRPTLNVNSRCHRKGWAPLHYAVEVCNLRAMTLLAQAGANLSATSATDKKLTPLELAKTKVKNAQSNTSREVAQKARDHLSALIAGQKSNSGKKSECRPSSTSCASAVVADEEESGKESNLVSTANGSSGHGSSKKGKKKKKSSEASHEAKAEEPKSSSNPSQAISKATQGSTTASPQKTSKNSAKSSSPPSSSGNSTSSPSNGLTALQGLSIASRDELVDRLLAMGFVEADCLAAISLYGTDIDRAISWLCDQQRPTAPTTATTANANASPAVSVIPSSSSSNINTSLKKEAGSKPSKSSLGKPEAKPAVPVAAPVTQASPNAASKLQADKEAAARLQKEKEELRRINRAWNARAEDEKRRLRQQAEEQRLRELQQKQGTKEGQNSAPLPHVVTPDPQIATAAGGIPIAPTLNWPTAAQAAALSSSPSLSSAPSIQHTTLPTARQKGNPVSNSMSSVSNNNGSTLHSGKKSSPRHDPLPSAYSNDNCGSPAFGLDSSVGGYNAGIASMSMYPSNGNTTSSLSYGLHFPPMPPSNVSPSPSVSSSIVAPGIAATGYNSAFNQTSQSSVSYYQEEEPEEIYVNGAIELSAGAKPFVPKSFVPLTPSSLSVEGPVASSPISFAPSSAFPSAMALGVGLPSASLWSSPATSSVTSAGILPPSTSVGNPFGGLGGSGSAGTADDFLNSYLSSEPLSLGADHFDFDAVAPDIIPDLDSLLSNEDQADFS